MTTGAIERLWKGGHGPTPSARFVTRRALLRALFLMAAFVLVYHVMSSVEQRGSFANVRNSVAPVQPTITTGEQAVSNGEVIEEEGFTQRPPPVGNVGPKVTLGKEKATLLMLVR